MVDINEYEKIVKKYREQLFKYCYYRLMQNKTLAQETLNDVIYVLYQKWDTLDKSRNIKAYLYRVADRCIKHNLEKYNRYYKYNESLEEAIDSNRFDREEQYDEYFENDMFPIEEYVEQISSSLPKESRQIFIYRYIENKTISEISELTTIPYSSLRLRLSKIENAVRDEVKKIFN